MRAYPSEASEGKLRAKFQTPLKRKQAGSDDAEVFSAPPLPNTPLPAVTVPLSHEPSFLCQWREPQTRKHKTWQGDAVLVLHGGASTASLRSVQTGKLWVSHRALMLTPGYSRMHVSARRP